MFTLFRTVLRLLTSKSTYVVLCFLAGIVLLYTWFTGSGRQHSIIELIEKENPAKVEQMRQLLSRYPNETQMLGFKYYQKNYDTKALQHYCNDLVANQDSVLSCLQMLNNINAWKGSISEEQLAYLDALAGQAVRMNSNSQPDSMEYTRAAVALSCLKSYNDILEHAAKAGADSKDLVMQNSISAMLYNILCMKKNTASKRDWELYCREHEWMTDMAMLLMVTPPSDVVISRQTENVELSSTDYLKSAIELCGKYPSMAKFAREIVQEWQQAVENNMVVNTQGNTEAELIAYKLPLLYEVYRIYGGVADSICTQSGCNVDELLNFLLLNEKELAEFKPIDFIHLASSILSDKNELIAYYAHMQSHFLRLYYEVGADTIREVLSKDAPQGCLYLLSAACSDELGNLNGQAARNAMAYAKKDPGHAFKVLNELGDDPRFKEIVAKDFRMMMYLDRFSENFEALAGDEWRGYIEKEITDQGEWKNHWVEYVPLVGSVLKVGQNWVSGYPCTWGELGWAAWEVGEGVACIVATATTGGGGVAIKMLSTSAKSSLKAGAKAAGKGLGKKVLKTGVQKFVKGSFKKNIMRRGVSLASKGLRAGKVMLKRQLPKALKNMAATAAKTAKGLVNVRNTFKLLAVGMILTEIGVRTLPNVDKIATAAGELAGDIIVAIQKVPMNILTEAAKKAASSQSSTSFLISGIILLSISLLLLFSKTIKRQFNKRFA